jgi:Na+/phosphate symporter
MSTKDPHIALIDAHEKLEKIKAHVRAAIELCMAKAQRGEKLTWDDQMMIKAIREEAIEKTKRVQDELAEELKGHGLN